MFDVLWTILLGIVGGIISSIIVSRVFLIQGEYQQQMKFVESIIRKLGMIAAYLFAFKAVFEVSYDEDIRIEQEMKEKGYKCEMEYYAAHKDKKWISETDLLDTFRTELLKVVETAKSEINNANIADQDLSNLLRDINEYLHSISSTKEFNFSIINDLKKTEQEILNKFDDCKRVSGKQLTKLVLKDKVMIALYILVGLIIVSTCLTFAFGL